MRPSLPVCGGPSSRAWLTRQFNDPYVKARLTQSPSALSPATRFRSRSAFKLVEMDAHYKLIHPGRTKTVIDLGAAPGGWSQVVSAKLGGFRNLGLERDERDEKKALDGSGWGIASPGHPSTELWSSSEPSIKTEDEDTPDVSQTKPTIIALDLLRILPIPGVQTLQTDFLLPAAEPLILGLLPDYQTKADLILCDMAANSSGNPTRDTEASYTIAQSVFDFATRHLKTCAPGAADGGSLVMKYFVSPSTHAFRNTHLKKSFRHVYHVKPDSSRSESNEAFWVCKYFLGAPRSPKKTEGGSPSSPQPEMSRKGKRLSSPPKLPIPTD
ncbi:23S ribosomal RNA methyltransferase [Sistotremastrum niveocremeum HHB9708]|uniref:rRNA methyltransferase 2, mitochondrial n=1 Tax=Sistotremastrum niveocremeum HHB9708 TaxID=1314777 RepID=A0A164WN79_9AGAM|nr:23S ribosomal RNA methyltransferase [Sistotremastrum niveocremeum HHB9708]